MWRFVLLRTPFSIDLPDNPGAIAERLASRIRHRPRLGFFEMPKPGEYIVGDIAGDGFSVECLKCVRRPRGVSVERRVLAKGTLTPTAGGTRVDAVVRQGAAMTGLNLLLFAFAAVCLLGWPLLFLEESIGPVLATGCGGLLLALLPLWLFVNVALWRAVRAGREQLVRALTET